jgi:hypothetical protein
MRSTGSRARHLWRLARTCWSQPLSCDGHPAKRSIGDQWKDLDVPTVTAAGPPSSFPDQTPAPSVLCSVYPGVPELSTGIVAAFRKGLNEAGFIEGRNVTVEFRFAYNDNARLPELAADLASFESRGCMTGVTPKAEVDPRSCYVAKVPILLRK